MRKFSRAFVQALKAFSRVVEGMAELVTACVTLATTCFAIYLFIHPQVAPLYPLYIAG